jgi:rubredoxin-NAD+ reductase
MAKWECIVCGWIYDEVTGDPESGLEPGTKWDDIPEDWLCPDCGVGKEDFELIESAEDDAASEHHSATAKPIVIIGTGLAGYNLVKEIRKTDKETPLIMITGDDGRSYSKPMLSTGFTRNTDADGLMMADAGKMAIQFDISVWTNTQVTNIDTAQQTVTAEGVVVEYASLVLAWGADVIRPPIAGDATDSVFSCNDLVDYAAFRAELKKRKAKKVVIIGGGLIGCEFTNDLLNGDFDIETVDPLGYCLPTLLPEAAGKSVQAALEEKGAKFHFGPLVTEVNKKDDALGVTLNNGDVLDADIVVSAVGVRPRIALAEQAGISVNRGVVANRLLETSAANVYTLGDCAEVEGNVLFYVAPLMACARALAKTLTGTPTQVSYPAMPVTIKTPACPVVVSPAPRDVEGEWTIQRDGNNVVAEFRNAAGELLGFALTGEGTAEKMRLQKELPAIMA